MIRYSKIDESISKSSYDDYMMYIFIKEFKWTVEQYKETPIEEIEKLKLIHSLSTQRENELANLNK